MKRLHEQLKKKRKRIKQKQWPEDEMVREARILL